MRPSSVPGVVPGGSSRKYLIARKSWPKEYRKAEDCFLESRQLWDDLHRRHPEERRYKRYLARSYGYLGDVKLELNRWNGAVEGQRNDAEHQERTESSRP